MTADQVKGKSFQGALRYNLEKVQNKVAEVLDMSFSRLSEDSIMKEVRMVRMQRPNLQKYFYHTSLNFPVHENFSNEAMLKIAHEYLEQNGFNQHQYLIVRHYDADHPHLHILVNRIGYDGSVVTDSQDYARSEKVIRALEQKYSLTQVISSREAKEKALTKNELEMMQRTGIPSAKIQLQVILKDLIKQPLTTEQFIKGLESRGVNVQFNQASTGFVSGISYGYAGLLFKGASLGNAYKWSAIKNVIRYEQERDGRAIREANIRTKAAAYAGKTDSSAYPRAVQANGDSRNAAQYSSNNQESGDHSQKHKQAGQRHAGPIYQHRGDDKNAPFESNSGAKTTSTADLFGRAIDGLFLSGASDYHVHSGPAPYVNQSPRKKKNASAFRNSAITDWIVNSGIYLFSPDRRGRYR
ncbi:relaxase/mobilization nuclease domain-containing protein [Fulvivirgaceae bacterium PWU5]|uniref:Relaxase/mobilization nuclease domain-containing protein n=1 Tax=Dawidia cretensis TaxID=2782350 RepID=A0AAP2E3F3_9BACT|nr:relaxase/mobilization nuclease domain-containing protein [Dawidia cretensis]MBT1712306.1 relaxase/mobilization nuclease domain-containing protein [Dawidia cretensis]